MVQKLSLHCLASIQKLLLLLSYDISRVKFGTKMGTTAGAY
jgi:hypothetical protein